MAELGEQERAALVAQAKRQIRARMRGLRSALPRAAVKSRSERIVQHLLGMPALEPAGGVALFWPIEKRNEVSLVSLDGALRAARKRLYYPFMTPTESGYRTGFRRLDDVERLEERGRGFAEPPLDAPVAARGDVDLVLVPALAVSADGWRIGYGIGFYDATLPDLCPPATSVAVAFAFQLLAEVPHDAGDQPCDWVVTDEGVTDARSARDSA